MNIFIGEVAMSFEWFRVGCQKYGGGIRWWREESGSKFSDFPGVGVGSGVSAGGVGVFEGGNSGIGVVGWCTSDVVICCVIVSG